MHTFLEFIQSLPTDRPAGTPPESSPSGMNFSFNFPKGVNVSYADITNHQVIDDINNHLEVGLFDALITPYVALERARKILAPYGIIIQGVAWLGGDSGEQIFSIYQWGGLYGSKGVGKSSGDVVDTDLTINPELSIYFAWAYSSEKNGYDIFCSIVNQEDLVDLLDTDFDGTRYDEQEDMKDTLQQ